MSHLVRRPDGVTTTSAGKRAIIHARNMLNEYNRFLELSEQPGKTPRFYPSSARTSLVPDCLLEFLRQYDAADIHFAMRETGSPDVVNDVYTGDADLGVIYLLCAERRSFAENLVAKRLAYEMVCPLRPHIISPQTPLLQSGEPITREMLYPYGKLHS